MESTFDYSVLSNLTYYDLRSFYEFESSKNRNDKNYPLLAELRSRINKIEKRELVVYSANNVLIETLRYQIVLLDFDLSNETIAETPNQMKMNQIKSEISKLNARIMDLY